MTNIAFIENCITKWHYHQPSDIVCWKQDNFCFSCYFWVFCSCSCHLFSSLCGSLSRKHQTIQFIVNYFIVIVNMILFFNLIPFLFAVRAINNLLHKEFFFIMQTQNEKKIGKNTSCHHFNSLLQGNFAKFFYLHFFLYFLLSPLLVYHMAPLYDADIW